MNIKNVFQVVLIVLFVGLISVRAQEKTTEVGDYENYHKESFFLVSPLVGWNRNKLYIPALPPRGPMPGQPAQTRTDTNPEYGLFALYFHPRMVINNMFFLTDASGSDITGNISFINFYGKPDRKVTWNVGGGYVWHEIKAEDNTITISVPMAKAGALIRIPNAHLLLNPYVAYAWQSVETDFSDEDTEAVLYGMTAHWFYRMFHLTMKYYYQDDQDSSEGYNVFRFRGIAFANDWFGLTGRFEYLEEPGTDNTSVLFGPVFVF